MKEKQFLQQLWQLIEDYLKLRSDREELVVDHKTPEELLNQFDFSISASGKSYDLLLKQIEMYLQFSPKTSHPLFVNQLYTGARLPGIAGDLISAISNTSMATYEISPVATLMEEALIKKMNSFTGYQNGDGIFCTGGSNANLLGMLNARQAILPEIKQSGQSGLKPLVMFISENAHYSFRKGANLMGIGTGNVIHIATDSRGRMLTDALREEIARSRQEGFLPFFIGATCGTTVEGSFDPLDDLAEIAKEERLWLHADGAWGGVTLLSKKYRHYLKGVEKTDSFTWDCHKLMGVPLIATAFLIKHKNLLHESTCDTRTEYLFHDVEHDLDLGVKSLQCGRKVDALKTWLQWQYFGDEGYDKRITKNIELAQKIARRIELEQSLELMTPVQYINICFRYNNDSVKDPDLFNIKLRDRLLQQGKAMVNYSELRGSIVIRLVLQNLDHTEEDLNQFLELILEEGNKMEKGE